MAADGLSFPNWFLLDVVSTQFDDVSRTMWVLALTDKCWGNEEC